MTPGIGFVGCAAFEFTSCGEAVVTALMILKTDLFDGSGKGVVGWVKRRIGPDHDVAPDSVAGRVTRQGRVAFAGAVTKDAITVRVAIGDVVRVDEAR